ncbi:hypothetical protein HGRIS_007709 [Hohenbuehelia grisea]|uniref:GST N-terminal domain-containing protein n=1 Tax=Hohenbuehelia grisea TaxID=104357 RepID=A0ABR3J5Q6_9AGAR
MSPVTLYTFGGSVWAAVPELAIHELEYPPDAIEKKVVNLVAGENFNPWFLHINPNGTLPTLEADGRAYTNTTDVVEYLVKNAPDAGARSSSASGKALIAEIHEDNIDPNFAFLLARNDEELTAKARTLPKVFLAQRQEALNSISATPEAQAFSNFYTAKLAGNGGLLDIYHGKAPATAKNGFFEQSRSHFENVAKYTIEILPQRLPTGTAFIDGEVPGETDFHVGAWLARIAATCGASKSGEGVKALEAAFGKTIPDRLQQYYNAWIARDSWKALYAEGLH